MSIFQKPKVETLPEWLEVATEKLADTAKERIQKEIEAHYAEAVEAHCSEGLTESAAEAAALDDLGDAIAAAKRFRAEHLTKQEVNMLANCEKASRSVSSLLVSYLVFFVMVVIDFQRRMRTHYCPFVFLVLEVSVLLVFFPTWCFFVAKRSNIRTKRHLLFVQPVSGFAFGYFFDALFERDKSFFGSWSHVFWGLWGLVMLYYISKYLRLWHKLRKVPAVRNGNPSQA